MSRARETNDTMVSKHTFGVDDDRFFSRADGSVYFGHGPRVDQLVDEVVLHPQVFHQTALVLEGDQTKLAGLVLSEEAEVTTVGVEGVPVVGGDVVGLEGGQAGLQVTVTTLGVALSVLPVLREELLQLVVIDPDVTEEVLLVTESLLTKLTENFIVLTQCQES